MKRVTIKDVATLAGVAPSTVSFVLNNAQNQSIPESTRKKIYDAAKELEYHPSYLAANMKNKQSKTIGIVSSYNVYSLYFADMLAGIISVAEKEGYGVLICESSRASYYSGTYERYFKSGRIDGVLFLSSAHSEGDSKEDEYIKSFEANDIPFVTVYGYTMHPGRWYVNMDFFQCGYEACQKLLSAGCRKLLYLAPLDKNGIDKFTPKTELDKILGCETAIHDFDKSAAIDIRYFPRDFKQLNEDCMNFIGKAAKELGYDGFIACWATFGMQLLNIFNVMSVNVPNDAKVISLDSLPYLEYAYPGLSSMQLPFFEIAQTGTETLIHNRLKKKKGGSEIERMIRIPCKFISRESTGILD